MRNWGYCENQTQTPVLNQNSYALLKLIQFNEKLWILWKSCSLNWNSVKNTQLFENCRCMWAPFHYYARGNLLPSLIKITVLTILGKKIFHLIICHHLFIYFINMMDPGSLFCIVYTFSYKPRLVYTRKINRNCILVYCS